jgi:DNA-binding response OmpR family regulator
MTSTHPDLSGRRILVVEDDYVQAADICDDLRRVGATVLGPAPTSHYAYSLLMGRRGVDGAILDIRLHGTDVFDLARELRERGVPMVFATGYGDDIPAAFGGAPLLNKPINPDRLIEVVGNLIREHTQLPPPVLETPEPSAFSMPERPLSERFCAAVARAMNNGH